MKNSIFYTFSGALLIVGVLLSLREIEQYSLVTENPGIPAVPAGRFTLVEGSYPFYFIEPGKTKTVTQRSLFKFDSATGRIWKLSGYSVKTEQAKFPKVFHSWEELDDASKNSRDADVFLLNSNEVSALK